MCRISLCKIYWWTNYTNKDLSFDSIGKNWAPSQSCGNGSGLGLSGGETEPLISRF